jgi:transposase
VQLKEREPGTASRLTDAQRQALVDIVEQGPIPAIHGVVRWRLIDLVQLLWEACRVSVSEATVGRELRALGFRKLSARSRHYAQDPEASEAFKNVWPAPTAS